MKAPSILFALVILLFLIAIRPAVPVAACALDDSDSHRCVAFRQSFATPTTAPLVAAYVVRGTSPSDALPILDAWQTLPPNTSVWYQTDDSPNFRALKIWLDANGQSGLRLAIFSPDQKDGLSTATKPIGYGAFSKNVPHDLHWSSDYSRWGVWYALVTNGNSIAVSYKLGMNQAGKETKNCISYWEYIGKDYVYWTSCNPAIWPYRP